MPEEGIINFLKPAGMTSHDAVYFLRKVTGIKRIGHTGTLDPMAAGVLPMGIGSGARVSEYLDLDEKSYRCEMILGLKTDTLDIWGTVTEDNRGSGKRFTEQDIMEAFCPLRGNIMQLPPKYSAIRVDGKRLYEYARKGESVEIKRRPVCIAALSIVDIDLAHGRVCFDVTSSKGTYIRSICEEAGDFLGCGAAMSFLLRKASGSASLSDAVTTEEILEEIEHPQKFIQSADCLLSSLGKLKLRQGRGKWFCNGGYLIEYDVTVEKTPFSEERERFGEAFEARLNHLKSRRDLLDAYRVYEDERFLGVAFYEKEEKRYVCDKVFYR